MSCHGSYLVVSDRLFLLSYVPVASVEAEAVVTYANNYLPYFIRPGSNGELTGIGFGVCVAFLGIFCLVNLLAVGWLLRVNSIITWWKIAVPVLTGVVLLIFQRAQQSAVGRSERLQLLRHIRRAADRRNIFSFLGFRTAIDLGGESANPHRDVPLAVIGSVVLAAAIYILLQFAFLLALSPADVAHGWAN